jgi:hypothetical protein
MEADRCKMFPSDLQMSHIHAIREYRNRHGNNSGTLPVVFFIRFLLRTIIVCFVIVATVWAQTSDSQSADSNKDWVTTSESQTTDANPTRTITRHSQSGGRTMDDQSVQVRGPNGDFQPYQDTEKETVQVDATTVRTTTRTFSWDTNGVKTLVQVTEEEKHSLPGGESDTTRAVSNADGNGNLQVVQREVEHTKNLGNDTEETKTTLMLPNVNGGLSPAREVQESRHHTAKHNERLYYRTEQETGTWTKCGTRQLSRTARTPAPWSGFPVPTRRVSWRKSLVS